MCASYDSIKRCCGHWYQDLEDDGVQSEADVMFIPDEVKLECGMRWIFVASEGMRAM